MNYDDARASWESRRLRYNVVLVVAGILSFVLYALVLEFVVTNPEAEITVFTTAFQAVGYLVAIGIANLFYSLGALSERYVRPVDPQRYRKRMFVAGTVFSAALPFAIPTVVALGRGHGR